MLGPKPILFLNKMVIWIKGCNKLSNKITICNKKREIFSKPILMAKLKFKNSLKQIEIFNNSCRMKESIPLNFTNRGTDRPKNCKHPFKITTIKLNLTNNLDEITKLKSFSKITISQNSGSSFKEAKPEKMIYSL